MDIAKASKERPQSPWAADAGAKCLGNTAQFGGVAEHAFCAICLLLAEISIYIQ